MTATAGDEKVHRPALVCVGLTFLLILAGGLVTSRDAGLAVPDWPLAYGQLNPPRWYLIENIRTEHGHRLVAAVVAMATIVLGLRIRRFERRPWVRKMGAAAVGLVALQALAGGLRVLRLSIDLAMVHGWLAQMFFALVVAIATVTAPGWHQGQAAVSSRIGRIAAAALVVVTSQLVAGLLVRHLSANQGSLATAGVFHLHVVLAAVILWLTVHMKRIVGREGRSAPIILPIRALPPLVSLQMGLGIASFAIVENMAFDRQANFLESWLPTMHVAAGAAILALCVTVAIRAFASSTAAAKAQRPPHR
jgi:cytochrome c oxidase assembly protein subunit 15